MTKINLDFDLWACTAAAEDITMSAKLDHCTITIKSKTTNSRRTIWTIAAFETTKENALAGPYLLYRAEQEFNNPDKIRVELYEEGDMRV